MSYGFTITAAGRNLLMRLQAGDNMNISRVMVGKGILGESNPAYLTDLISPVCLASSTVPIIQDNILKMIIEYRNDMNGGLKDNFWLSEYGIFAKDQTGSEVLLYYADLSDFPEPVIAWNANKPRLVTKRYPVEIIMIEDKVTVNLDFVASAFVIHEELANGLNTKVDKATLRMVKYSVNGEQLPNPLIVNLDADGKAVIAEDGNGTHFVYSKPFSDEHSYIRPISELAQSERDDFVALLEEVDDKVDKVSGKQLSTEDFTSAEKNKLSGISDGANKYVHPLAVTHFIDGKQMPNPLMVNLDADGKAVIAEDGNGTHFVYSKPFSDEHSYIRPISELFQATADDYTAFTEELNKKADKESAAVKISSY